MRKLRPTTATHKISPMTRETLRRQVADLTHRLVGRTWESKAI